MEQFLRLLLTVSLSGSVLILLLMINKPFWKKTISKSFSYYIWLVVLLRLILPFGYEIPIPGGPQLFTKTSNPISADGMPFYNNILPDDSISSINGIPGNLSPFDTPAFSDSTTPSDSRIVIDTYTSSNPDTSPDQQTSLYSNPIIREPAGTRVHRLNMDSVLFHTWVAGVILSIGWNLLSYAIFMRKLTRSFTIPAESDLAVFREIRGKNKICLVCSDMTEIPMLIGLFRQVIVLPKIVFVKSNMEVELRGILCHELKHYERRDTLYKWIVVLVTALHWFNPLVYLLRREVSQCCELSCDEAVIRKFTEAERREYGNVLLKLASKQRFPVRIQASALGEGKRHLKDRLLSIKNFRQKGTVATIVMFSLCVIFTCCAGGVLSFGSETKQGGEPGNEIPPVSALQPVNQSTPIPEKDIDNLPSGTARIDEPEKEKSIPDKGNTSLLHRNDLEYLIENGILYRYTGTDEHTEVSIPEGVISIADEAFLNNEWISRVTIPDTVTKIGSRVFYGCSSLKSVRMEDSVTEIGGDVFRQCTSLMHVRLSNSLQSLPTLFDECDTLACITLPEALTYLNSNDGLGSFSDGLKAIILPPEYMSTMNFEQFLMMNTSNGIPLPDIYTTTIPKEEAVQKRITKYRLNVHLLELVASEIVLEVGEFYELRFHNGGYRNTPKATWSSADSSVASIDLYGNVTAVSEGMTVITAEIYGKEYDCLVKVGKNPDV